MLKIRGTILNLNFLGFFLKNGFYFVTTVQEGLIFYGGIFFRFSVYIFGLYIKSQG